MRLLMCLPKHFDVTYEINAWMRIANGPDPGKARAQWSALYTILREEVGADVSLVAPQPGLPDMVFTANAGLTKGNWFVPSRFRPVERQGEVAFFIQWMLENGFHLKPLTEEIAGAFEGEGDALFYGDLLLTGYGQRSDKSACLGVGELLGVPVLPLGLTDGRWYHLDTCLIPVSPELLAYYPPAFDAEANVAIEALPGEKIILTESDALRFGGNAVVAGQQIVMNSGCDALAGALRTRGYTVHETDLSEFIKSGGSAKCLVLVLEH
jgi:N-dimethylarginine dimethylaminohydrolase